MIKIRFSSRVRTAVASSAAGAVLVICGVSAAAQQTGAALPDAQIEANVLRALASAPELSTQNIQSATVYGTVTLSGNVHDEQLRVKAENLVARAQGVKKVMDQLSLGDTPAASANNAPEPDTENGNVAPANAADNNQAPPPGMVLQSDGTYGPADGGGVAPPNGQQQTANNQTPPAPGPPTYGPPQQYPQQQGYQQGPQQGRQPLGTGNYGPGRGAYQPPAGVQPGQQAGLPVGVPAGTVLHIRINRGLDSQHIQPGAQFDGTVLTDVVSNGAVAIPRGATVQGNVVDAKKAGVFKGEGTIALQLNTLTLGGNVYLINTQVWVRDGKDKTAGTVNRTVGVAAIGALFGAIAGGGEGAAIGAGVGGAAGLASSAGGPRGQIIIPPESMLSFTTAQPVEVRTVSQAEMARLSYAAGPGQQARPPMRRYYSPYYGWYWAPAPGYGR